MNQNPKTSSQRPISAWRSPWLLGSIGLIAAVLAVNATMVYFAVTTSPGLVKEDYYERGRDYERTLASRLASAAQWTMRLDVPPDIEAGVPTTLRFFVVDAAGRPGTPERGELYAYRPADARRDFSTPMVAEGRGRYAAQISFPLIGVWDTLVAATVGGEEQLIGERVRVGHR